MLKKSIPVFGLILCLSILTLGCARGVEEAPATTTTTTITTTTTTTTTSTTTTTTTSTTTTTIHGISGTITDYGGTAEALNVLVWKDQLEGGPVASATATVSGTQAAYSLTVEAAGNYYVVATDFDLGLTPEAHDWIGAYGWEGTGSIAAAGNFAALWMALQQNAGSIEVSSIVTAEFTMHEIITPPTAEGYTVSGTVDPGLATVGSPEVVILSTSSVLGGGMPMNAAKQGTIPAGGAHFSYTLITTEAGTYYVWCVSPFGQGVNPEYWGAYGGINSATPVTLEAGNPTVALPVFTLEAAVGGP